MLQWGLETVSIIQVQGVSGKNEQPSQTPGRRQVAKSAGPNAAASV